MTWSFQLTVWALPPILAVLLVVRNAEFLWPRRREAGTRVLLGLCVAVGVWALLDLVSAVTPALDLKMLATRVEYLPAMATAVLWAGFGREQGARRKVWARWPMLLLYAGSAAVVAAALTSVAPWVLLHGGRLVDLGGTAGLEVDHGWGNWLALGLRAGAVLGGSWITFRHLARAPELRNRSIQAVTAALLALAPVVALLAVRPGAEWADVSSLGFAMGGTLLVWGLLRPKILNLGPVDREVVLRELHDPLVVMDGRGRIVDANRAAREGLGLATYGDVPVVLGRLWATGPAPEHTPPPRIDLPNGEGETRTFEVTVTPLGDGASRRSALLLRDVTVREGMRRDLERANAELERLARTDPLTGLSNRRHFMEVLEREVERSRRYARPLSVVILDLDHFKNVNDTHGHAAGDGVLVEAAKVLRSVCRDLDLAARLGGEELALILPETEVRGAHTVAERVREKIEAASHVSPTGQQFTVTTSIGVAAAAETTPNGEALLQASDQALYRAKARGRNRVELADRGD